jgi:hypothetical protein
MKVVNRSERWIGYRLNILGIRVWEEGSCQLVAINRGRWGGLGPRWDLPVNVPETAEDLKLAAADTLRLTAFQYVTAHPESDLADVLAKRKDFEAAMQDANAAISG